MQYAGEGLRVFIFSADDNPTVFRAFSRFRYFYFVQCLGWRLSVDNERETDEFDSDGAVYCVVVDGDQVIGGWRALPTLTPYLAQTLFPQLATSEEYPRCSAVWEMTRLGATRHQELIYGLMFRFAVQRHARSLVAVIDTAHERLLRRYGIRTERYGRPRQIGFTCDGRPIEAVAGEIPLGDQDPHVIERFLTRTYSVEITDETLVLGSASLSA